jgi:hypothetical protein
MRYLATALIAGIGLYAAVVTALWALQRDLMYFPDGAPRVPPSSYGMLGGVQEVLLTTADALELAAWYVPAPPTRPTVVMSTVDVAALRFQIVPAGSVTTTSSPTAASTPRSISSAAR